LGGFSFPVTSGPEDVLQKVYKSWPSVKSSASDALATNLEEVSGTHTADYLDESESHISSTVHVSLCETLMGLDMNMTPFQIRR
jgi:hypothetical protein